MSRGDEAARQRFMNGVLKEINADPNHPLTFLVDPLTKNWLGRSHLDPDAPSVQAGHLVSRHSGEPESFALEDAYFNQRASWKGERLGVIECRECIDIGGIPVEKRTAELWEAQGAEGFPGLTPGTVANAPESTGWSSTTPGPGAEAGPAIAHPPGAPAVSTPMNNPGQAISHAAEAAVDAVADAVPGAASALLTGSALFGFGPLILTGALAAEAGEALVDGAKALSDAVSDALGDQPQSQESSDPTPTQPPTDDAAPVESAPADKPPHAPTSPADHWVGEPDSELQPAAKPLAPADHWVQEPNPFPLEPPSEGEKWFQAPDSTPDGTEQPSQGSMWTMGAQPDDSGDATDASSSEPAGDNGSDVADSSSAASLSSAASSGDDAAGNSSTGGGDSAGGDSAGSSNSSSSSSSDGSSSGGSSGSNNSSGSSYYGSNSSDDDSRDGTGDPVTY